MFSVTVRAAAPSRALPLSVWGGMPAFTFIPARLDMFGGKLTGGKVTGKGGGGAIALDDQQCIFNMYGGEISGNNGNNYGGAIFRKFNANMPNTTGGTFNMYGGTIKDNTAKNGGAFFSTTGGTINMTGGTISGNKATQSNNDAGGGAIYMRGNGKIDISGSAEITGNSSSLDGGAILMGWGDDQHFRQREDQQQYRQPLGRRHLPAPRF